MGTGRGFTFLGRIARATETALRMLTSLAVITAVVPVLILLNVKGEDITALRDYNAEKSACLDASVGNLNLSSCRKAMELFCDVQRRQLIQGAPVPPQCRPNIEAVGLSRGSDKSH